MGRTNLPMRPKPAPEAAALTSALDSGAVLARGLDSNSPKVEARTSLTPPTAWSRFVWQLITVISFSSAQRKNLPSGWFAYIALGG